MVQVLILSMKCLLLVASSHVTVFFFINVRFLGSVEVNGFKGNEIICDAMKEVQHKSFKLDF